MKRLIISIVLIYMGVMLAVNIGVFYELAFKEIMLGLTNGVDIHLNR